MSVSTIDELAELLQNFYKMESIEGSKFLKKSRVSDEDLQSLTGKKEGIIDMIIDAYDCGGDDCLSVTEKTLPKRACDRNPEYFATAALHAIAKALQVRSSKSKAYDYIEKASNLLWQAQHHHKIVLRDIADTYGLDVQVLKDDLAKTKNPLAQAAFDTAKKRAKKRKEFIILLVDKLNTYIAKHYLGEKYDSYTPLANDLWRDEVLVCRADGKGFAGLTPEQTDSYLMSKNALKKALKKTTVYIKD